MATKSTILTPTKKKLQTVIVDMFAGIDRSTARFRIEGKGERLYEAKNVFPYIQGRLQRRFDSTQTNLRVSSPFPTFPAQSLSGNPIFKTAVEFNDHICILYEDSGDTSKLLVDRFHTGNNTLIAVITKTSNAGNPFTFDTNGRVDAVIYDRKLYVDLQGSKVVIIARDWTSVITTAGNQGEGICEVFLQSCVHINKGTKKIGRITPGGNDIDFVIDELQESPGDIIKLLSFGYQTSSSGATSLLLIFKPSSIYILTGIGATESMEQVVGNVGLVGEAAWTYTPHGVTFIGRDTDGLLNIYLLDRSYFVMNTIGHELYEELNIIPPSDYDKIIVSYHRNRMVRIAMTKTGDATFNLQEYWLDFYNGIKKRTLWGPFPVPVSNSIIHAISFSGGGVPANAGYFKLLKEGNTLKIYEDVNTDTYDSVDSEWDDQVWRTKMYDFGNTYGIVGEIIVVARANGAKFKIYYEKPKFGGNDDDTVSTLIGNFQMGVEGDHRSKPIRIVPATLARQISFKIESDYDTNDNNPFELSQLGFKYEVTGREVIE